MAKDVHEEVEIVEDDDAFLPDGWEEGMDIFAEDASEGDTDSDGSADDAGSADANETDEAGGSDEAPTTDDDSTEGNSNAEEQTEETSADGQETQPARSSRILKLKFNHAEEDFDVDKASDEDLAAMIQKSKAFDKMKEDQSKELYRKTYEELIDSGMPELMAKMGARDAAGREYALADEEPTTPEVEEHQSGAPSRDFASDLKTLQSLRPDITSMPKEVMDSYLAGADLLSAYLLYENGQSKKAAVSLQKENEILKQNAASAAKAPVKGVTGGGNTDRHTKDPGLEGFDKDPW